MQQTVRVVNFGYAKRGLSTVGYTLYNTDNTEKQARTTTGVTEVGTDTGIYSCKIDFDEGFEGIILWSTTATGSIRYATQEYLPQLTTIQAETDLIRLIWNSLKNQGEFFNKLSKLSKIPKLISAMGLDKLGGKIDKLNKGITPAELTKALTSANPKLPDIKIPDVPDYTEQMNNLKKSIDNVEKNMAPDMRSSFVGIRKELNKIPKEYKDYSREFASLNKNISNLMSAKLDKIDDVLDGLKQAFLSINTNVNKLDTGMGEKINTGLKNAVSPQMIYQQISAIERATNILQEVKKQNTTFSLLGIGRK